MKGLPRWRQHTDNEITVLNDIKNSKVSYDRITEFSIRPPKFHTMFDKVGNYFRWFDVERKFMRGQQMDDALSEELRMSFWIDGLRRQVKMRKKDLKEIMDYINKIDDVNSVNLQMINLFRDINDILGREDDLIYFSDSEIYFYEHVKKNLIEGGNDDHLPIPVYSYIKSTMGVQFILYILLSIGFFSTEIDLIHHSSLHDSLRYAKLIGSSNDKDSLQSYSNDLLIKFIFEQLVYFPNYLRLIFHFIRAAADLFDSIIVRDEIPISDMPLVQIKSLFSSKQLL